MTQPSPHLPENVAAALRRAKRLEWWTIGFLLSIIAVVGLASGGSQAMQTAWVEDILSLLPPISFLVVSRLETIGPTRKYPFGFARAHSLAFFLASAAVLLLGALLFYHAVSALLRQEHPTIGSIRLFDLEIWLGWVMIAALCYSVVPPVILGRLKKPVAKTLSDEVIHTDALMNAADWQTGAAGVVGLAGVAFGYWWADSAAAAFIALSVLYDGGHAFAISVAELIDGAPRKLGTLEIDPLADRISAALMHRFPGSRVRMRETGRYTHAVVTRDSEPEIPLDIAREIAGKDEAWRLLEVGVTLRQSWPASDPTPGERSESPAPGLMQNAKASDGDRSLHADTHNLEKLRRDVVHGI